MATTSDPDKPTKNIQVRMEARICIKTPILGSA